MPSILLAALLAVAPFSSPAAAESMETLIATVALNGQKQGEFFVKAMPGGDFLVRADDLKAMRMVEPEGQAITLEGEKYFSLKSLKGLVIHFDPKNVALDLTVDPSYLPKQTLDLMPKRSADVEFTRDNSVFFNYAANYIGSQGFSSHGLNIYNELGIRLGDFLFFSDSSYRNDPLRGQAWIRGISQIVYDRRETLQRAIAGDTTAFSGELGSGISMGGLSFSKIYRINPYFIRYPLPTIAGSVSTPSTLDIFLDGMMIGSNKLNPGEYDLRNISYYRGLHTVDMVLRDTFGREQTINYPYYYSDILLGEGLHEYSYNLGFMRKNIGTDKDSYGPLAGSAFHRYGITNFLTLGLSGEGAAGLYNLGGSAAVTLGSLGNCTLSASGSRYEGDYGHARAAGYTFQGHHFSANFRYRADSRQYATLERLSNQSMAGPFQFGRIRSQISASVGYADLAYGSLSFGYFDSTSYNGQQRQGISARYSKTFYNHLNLSATAGKISDTGNVNGSGYEFSVGLVYYFGDNQNISVRHEEGPQGDGDVIRLQKNIPAGEGYAYNIGLVRRGSSSGQEYAANPMFQYNGPYGIYRGQYDARMGSDGKINDVIQLSAAGGIAYVGGTLGLSRPVTDSFGLVKVGEVENVKVSVNNQYMGKTNASGEIFIPRMSSYYDNMVTIDDKDLPINYSLSGVKKNVSPPLRSGALIHFDAIKVQAVTGYLKARRGGRLEPVEFVELRITSQGVEHTSSTGKGGEFYFENLKAGIYQGVADHAGGSCHFNLAVPETEEMFIELGEVACESTR